MSKNTRASFMNSKQSAAIEAAKYPPRSHQNCIKFTGVARPGKTAKDKASR